MTTDLNELLILTPAQLAHLPDFDSALELVRTSQVTEMDLAPWWSERARRIEAGRLAADAELEAWLMGGDEVQAELVVGEDEAIYTLPSFFWGFACDDERWASKPIRSMGADHVEVALNLADLDELQGVVEATYEDVAEGSYVDCDLEGAPWWVAQRQQVRWLDEAQAVLTSATH